MRHVMELLPHLILCRMTIWIVTASLRKWAKIELTSETENVLGSSLRLNGEPLTSSCEDSRYRIVTVSCPLRV